MADVIKTESLPKHLLFEVQHRVGDLKDTQTPMWGIVKSKKCLETKKTGWVFPKLHGPLCSQVSKALLIDLVLPMISFTEENSSILEAAVSGWCVVFKGNTTLIRKFSLDTALCTFCFFDSKVFFSHWKFIAVFSMWMLINDDNLFRSLLPSQNLEASFLWGFKKSNRADERSTWERDVVKQRTTLRVRLPLPPRGPSPGQVFSYMKLFPPYSASQTQHDIL